MFLTALSDVAVNQERAARRIGADVLGMVHKLRELFPPEEDLPTAIRLVTELANEAQTDGVSAPDARERLVEASRAIEASSMEVYRRFARAGAIVRPEDVWDLIDDPRPRLQALLTFATLTQRMFTNVELYLTNQARDGEAVDLASAARKEMRPWPTRSTLRWGARYERRTARAWWLARRPAWHACVRPVRCNRTKRRTPASASCQHVPLRRGRHSKLCATHFPPWSPP